MKLLPFLMLLASLAMTVAEEEKYSYFGQGQCRDSLDRDYSYVRYDDISDVDECAALCEHLETYEKAMVGLGLYSYTSSSGFVNRDWCFCYYDADYTVSGLGADDKGTGKGAGAVAMTTNNRWFECYAKGNFVQPTPRPTNAPSSAPSMAPSISFFPTQAPSISHVPTMAPTFRALSTREDLLDAVDLYLAGKTDRELVEAEFGPIEDWNVENIEDFSLLFSPLRNTLAAYFNVNIGSWNVGNGVTFFAMFYQNAEFNQDLSGWNMGSATNLDDMIYGASNFRQDLRSWNIDTDVTSVDNIFWLTNCESMVTPGQSTIEGKEGYFCATVDGTPVLTKDDFFKQAGLASQLCEASYFEDDIDVDKIDGFDSENVSFWDMGNYNYDTVIVARESNVVYVAFRGTYISVDFWSIEYSSSEIEATQDSTASTFFSNGQQTCKTHEGLTDNYMAHHSNTDSWETMYDVHMDECESIFGRGNCETVITGHSSGSAIAMAAAAYMGIFNKDVRVMNFGGVKMVKNCDFLFNTDMVYNFAAFNLFFNDPVPFMSFDEGFKHIGPLIMLYDKDNVYWYDDANDLSASEKTWLSISPNFLDNWVQKLDDSAYYLGLALTHQVTTYSGILGTGRKGVTIGNPAALDFLEWEF